VQNTFTGLKVLGLVMLIGSTFLNRSHGVSQEAAQLSDLSPAQLGAAMIACIWAYNGWFAVSLIGGEVKEPQRNLPRALIAGTALVTCIYLLANIGYLRTLTVAEIAASDRVAASAAARTMGTIGSSFVAFTILVSTFGTTNGNIMTAPRLYFAQARDGLFFRAFGNIHPVFKTPYLAIVGQGIWASVLVLSGSYAQLVSFATFTFWIFYGMTVAGLAVSYVRVSRHSVHIRHSRRVGGRRRDSERTCDVRYRNTDRGFGRACLLLVAQTLHLRDPRRGAFRRKRRLRLGHIRGFTKRSQSIGSLFRCRGLLFQFHLLDPSFLEGGCLFLYTALLLKSGEFVESAVPGALDRGQVALQALKLFGLLYKDSCQAYR
jgi:amino acid permease